ncbi:Crp/Fnr family transcriptional regulator [Planococcus lenghuensis]|uniref:Crp/Fnr family transcriptional regulator n=1 Tax=Planococcus lenghuensis TaxID=2213202 RepID=A0A1Q2KUR5_9BACL|nr:Crp/Fnr family transcriptional regulator [Planococcus lenghuensis]AQQ51955.1 hypothetical protein B0X71_01680 [Planococcus lenghuensis]
MIRTWPLFADLPPEAEALLLDMASRRTFSQHSFIFRQDEPLTYLHFVVRGKVKIHRVDISGKEQVVSFQQDGDMFPHIGIFREGNYPADAIAVTETEIILVSVDNFKKLMEAYPAISYNLHRVMEEKVIDLQKRLSEMIMNSANERVLLLLARLSNEHGRKDNQGRIVFTSRFTNMELANMIGTARETVNRCIAQLKAHGVLDVTSGGFFRIDPLLLEEELFKR